MVNIIYQNCYLFLVKETKISVGGRIVIPKEMREKLKMEEGEKVIISLEGRKLIIKPKNMVEKPVEKLYGSVKVISDKPKKEARKWMRERIKNLFSIEKREKELIDIIDEVVK